MKITGTEGLKDPLQRSQLHKKGLCDYVVNVASGCLHKCTFCYVPSTPVIRTRVRHFSAFGIEDPSMEWGNYLLLRPDAPVRLRDQLARQRTFTETPSGKGVVLLCSGTDPFQNRKTTEITLSCVESLLAHNMRVRILARGLSGRAAIERGLLSHPNLTFGMSIPSLDDHLCRRVELHAPPPSLRYKTMQLAKRHGVRRYVAIAPTVPTLSPTEFSDYLARILELEPELLFWEPINARGSNGKRMANAGLDFASTISTQSAWADNFLRQWDMIEAIADQKGVRNLLHIWADAGLKKFTDPNRIDEWIERPTIEQWQSKEK